MSPSHEPESLSIPASRVQTHLRETLALAWPIVMSRMAVMAMFVTDTIMVGRYASDELAYLSIGLAPTSPIVVASIGLLMGTMVVTANAFGAGRFEDCGRALRRAVPYAFALSLVAVTFTLFGEPFLRWSGQSEELAVNGGRIMLLVGIGMPAQFVSLACISFLEGVKRPVPGMIMMILANFINIGVNWLLISGNLGFPAMGAAGAVWGTTAARYAIMFAAIAYILRMRGHQRFGVRNRPGGVFRDWQKQRRIGYGAGTSGGVEAGAFAAMNLFAGLIGTTSAAAYFVGNNLLGVAYMMAIGIGAATAIRIGIAHGAGKPREIALAGWTGLGLNFGGTMVLAILFFALPATIAGVYATDETLIEMIAAFMTILAMGVVLDGAQSVMSQALRGMGETVAPTVLHFIAYVGVMIPLAWYLTFNLGQGIAGLFGAIIIASAVALALLAGRFQFLAVRTRRQLSM